MAAKPLLVVFFPWNIAHHQDMGAVIEHMNELITRQVHGEYVVLCFPNEEMNFRVEVHRPEDVEPESLEQLKQALIAKIQEHFKLSDSAAGV